MGNNGYSAIFLPVFTLPRKKTVTTYRTLDLDSPTFYLLVTVFVASVIILPLVPVTLFIYTNLS